MKALVLSGGAGTRLRPITHTSAKQLIPVANKPVLFYGLESVRAAGITEVGIVVGETSAEIRDAVGDGSRFGLDVTYIPQEAPLGLAHAVLVSRDYLGEDDFVMYLGDNLVVGGIASLVERFTSGRPAAQILLTRVPNPRAFGIVELDGTGRIVGLEEKPRRPKSDMALVGVYMFTPAIHEAIRHIEPSWRNELEITHAVQWMIDAGLRVDSTVVSGYWKDTGSVEDMLEVNRMLLESLQPCADGDVDESSELIGRVVVERGARVRASRILGPVIVGAGSRIDDAYLGPFTSIGDGCRVDNAEIEYSIMLPGSSLADVGRVESSLIGRDVQVTSAPKAPKAHRLVLGDHSQVRISS